MSPLNNKLAAIDIGTNSLHMLVAEVDDAGKFRIIDRERDFVMLGRNMSESKCLDKNAVSAAIASLKKFKAIAEGHHASIRAVATSAVREASNGDAFIKKVKRDVSLSVEIISGFEEARLIYSAAMQAVPAAKRKILLVDIGGGSTEFLVGEKGRVSYENSLKIGTTRLLKPFFKTAKLETKSIAACRQHVKGMLAPVVREIKQHPFQSVVGTSGTILNLAGMVKGMRKETDISRLNNFVFSAKELFKAGAVIFKTKTARERSGIRGIDPLRAEIIVPGTIILEQIFRQFGIREMTVSEYALREGIIFDAIQKKWPAGCSYHPNIKNDSVLALAEHFRYDKKHAYHTLFLASRIFEQLSGMIPLNENSQKFLEAAAILHDIGFFVSHAQHHRHSYYLIRNAELPGFTENEKEIIANIARYHRKSHPKPTHEAFQRLEPEDRKTVRVIAGILRIADGLDRTHASTVKNLTCKISGKKVLIGLNSTLLSSSLDLEIWGAQRKKGLLEEALGVEIVFMRQV